MKNICLIALLSLFCCQTDLKSIEGHWHPLDLNNTLDIKNNLVIIDKNNPIYFDQRLLIRRNGKFYLPLGGEGLSGYLSVKNDTLRLSSNDRNNKYELFWIKHEDSLYDLIEEFNKNKIVRIALDTNNHSFKFKIDYDDFKWAMINFGYPMSEQFRQDSIVMQLNDVFASFSDLGKFLEIEKSMWETEQSIDIILNSHIETPKLTLDTILNILDDYAFISNVYKTTLNVEQGFIGLQKIR